MALQTHADWSRGVVLRSRATRGPIDLSGWSLELVVKAKRADDAPLLTLSTDSGGLELDPTATGRFIISMSAQQTGDLGAGERVFAVYRTDGGRRQCVLSGRMIVKEGV